MTIVQNINIYKETIVGCGILLIVGFPKHGAISLFLAFFFIVPLTIHNVYLIYKDKQSFKTRSTKMSVWYATVTIVVVHHVYLHQVTRILADQVLVKIAAYHGSEGVYPESIADMYTSQIEFDEARIFYSLVEDKPVMFYPVTYVPFDTFDYDFEKLVWVYRGS